MEATLEQAWDALLTQLSGEATIKDAALFGDLSGVDTIRFYCSPITSDVDLLCKRLDATGYSCQVSDLGLLLVDKEV